MWARYHARHDVAERDVLIVHYLPLVRSLARRARTLLSDEVELEDLVSDGTFGLVDAIERFDARRGCAFSTYAAVRIRGAMLDALRANDWAPRSVRAAARRVETASAELEASLGRIPTEAEVAQRLGISRARYRRVRADVENAVILPLEELLSTRDADPLAAEDGGETRAILANALGSLPEREARVVWLHDLVGMTLLEISGLLGISHSRTSQVHGHALRLLRRAFEETEGDDAR
ncbi:MAG: sigma-70 family RNA polymerase sigma factor [Actinomycetota bacterium]